MTPRALYATLAALLSALAAFVWTTAGTLPPTVASHFGFDGTANGFSSRAVYTAGMLVLVVALPALVGVLPGWLGRKAGVGLNIPHRAWWLAPERRESTLNFLAAHGAAFALLLAAFLAWVHWLVVQAHQASPARLPFERVLPALLGLGLASAAWVGALVWRFGRRR